MAQRLIVLVTGVAIAVAAPIAAQRNNATLDTVIRSAVEQKRVPMVVAMVADARGIIYEQAAGANKDAIFAIASMTKPITSVALMQLIETGKVRLEEPAATYLPELAKVPVLDGGKMRAQKTPITVRHLLTHTAGFGYEFLNADLLGLVAKKEVASVMAGGDAFLKAPLMFDAGARWEYGINTDWLGRLVERVSGQSLDVYFREKIFAPLGMTDTYFVVPREKQARVVATFQRNQDGTLGQQPAAPAAPVTFFSGGGGLFSTAADYVKFMRALMAGGELDGRRILSVQSVAAMGSNQIGALPLRQMTGVIPQLTVATATLPGALDKFGLGFALNSKPIAGGRGANTMSWAGIFNTFFWIDREKQICAVVMTQMLPFLDEGPSKLIEDFDRAVYAK